MRQNEDERRPKNQPRGGGNWFGHVSLCHLDVETKTSSYNNLENNMSATFIRIFKVSQGVRQWLTFPSRPSCVLSTVWLRLPLCSLLCLGHIILHNLRNHLLNLLHSLISFLQAI